VITRLLAILAGAAAAALVLWASTVGALPLPAAVVLGLAGVAEIAAAAPLGRGSRVAAAALVPLAALLALVALFAAPLVLHAGRSLAWPVLGGGLEVGLFVAALVVLLERT
jgi:hypothetical protein